MVGKRMTDKGRGRSVRLLAGLLVLGLVLATVPATPVLAASQKTGWATKSGKKYYYKKGKKVKGWKKIGSYTYFFDSKGVMQTNKIVGNSKGIHYVGKDGIRCKDTAIEVAKNLVLELTDNSMSRREKLETVYSYLVYDCSYLSDYYVLAPVNFSYMARRMASRHGGDCYEGALLMVYVARVLGYTGRMERGYVDSNLYPSQVGYLAYTAGNEHGWPEIKVSGSYLVYDISMQRAYSARLHGITRRSYPYAIRSVGEYKMKVSKGRVIWY